MSNSVEIKTPDLGDFEDVPIIEIFVNEGDTIEKDDPLLAIESDKATMEIPATDAGKIEKIKVSVGDEVSSGMVLMTLVAEESENANDSDQDDQADDSAAKATEDSGDDEKDQEKSKADDSDKQSDGEDTDDDAEEPDDNAKQSKPGKLEKSDHGDVHGELVVLGSGPGGYSAAFRAADLGLDVILIERYSSLGGVCLNVGCIPSKALLHVAKVITESAEAGETGVQFASPEIDIEKTSKWKSGVVTQLTRGLGSLAKKRKVNVIQGIGKFTSANKIEVENEKGKQTVSFDQAIIAAGSQSIEIPGFPHDDPRVMDSTDALELDEIPESLLIIGGGIIGLELATVYHALGSKISVVEMLDTIMAGADSDLVRPLLKRLSKQYQNIWLKTKVSEMNATDNGIKVSFEGDDAPDSQVFDRVLVAVGRSPNGDKIEAQAAGVKVTDRGFIEVNDQQRTNVDHIFAIGDVVGQPMLAHKAVHEGKVAAEVAAGMKSGFDARVIPSVAYTDPEVAWVGVTESEAKEQGLDYGKGAFPWAASGRSLSQGRNEGITKLLFEKESGRIIGAGITGSNAGDLIAEAALAIEMNADAQDIGLTIHAHPTLAETIGFAAEAFEGTITDLYMPKK